MSVKFGLVSLSELVEFEVISLRDSIEFELAGGTAVICTYSSESRREYCNRFPPFS